MSRRVLVFALAASLLGGMAHAAADEGESFILPSVGGLALAPDATTLIISVPSKAQLVYIDTAANKESKRVTLPFKPGCLAIQGESLFAAAMGAAGIHVLDWKSGKEKAQIDVPGEPIQSLVCDPKKGLLYGATTDHVIVSIDPETRKHSRSEARGAFLALAARDGSHLYAGVQKPLENHIELRGGPRNSILVRFDRTGERATLLKYKVSGFEIELEAANENSAVLGRGLAASPDGTRVAMAGNGGWRTAANRRPSHTIAVFDTKDLKTMAGQIDTESVPNNLAFHPLLDIGIAEAVGPNTRLMVFNASTYAETKSIRLPRGVGNAGDSILLFVQRGRKIAYCDAAVEGSSERAVHLLPLPLTAKEKATLDKASPGK